MSEYILDEYNITYEMVSEEEGYEALVVLNNSCNSYLNGNDIKITFPDEDTYHEYLVDWPFLVEPSVTVSWFEDY